MPTCRIWEHYSNVFRLLVVLIVSKRHMTELLGMAIDMYHNLLSTYYNPRPLWKIYFAAQRELPPLHQTWMEVNEFKLKTSLNRVAKQQAIRVELVGWLREIRKLLKTAEVYFQHRFCVWCHFAIWDYVFRQVSAVDGQIRLSLADKKSISVPFIM